jgi:hypothetical protein
MCDGGDGCRRTGEGVCLRDQKQCLPMLTDADIGRWDRRLARWSHRQRSSSVAEQLPRPITGAGPASGADCRLSRTAERSYD